MNLFDVTTFLKIYISYLSSLMIRLISNAFYFRCIIFRYIEIES